MHAPHYHHPIWLLPRQCASCSHRNDLDGHERVWREWVWIGANERRQTQTSVNGHKRVWMDANAHPYSLCTHVLMPSWELLYRQEFGCTVSKMIQRNRLRWISNFDSSRVIIIPTYSHLSLLVHVVSPVERNGLVEKSLSIRLYWAVAWWVSFSFVRVHFYSCVNVLSY